MRKNSVAHSLIVVIALAVLATACPGREKSAGNTPSQTQTIAPAAGQPSPTGTDAMTQTVEVEDSRSEADGGVITSGGEKKAAPPAPAKAAGKKKKK